MLIPAFTGQFITLENNSTKTKEKRVQRILKKIESEIGAQEYKILYPINSSPRKFNKKEVLMNYPLDPLREMCPYSEFFWSVFSRTRTEYENKRSIPQYSVRMRENTDQKNSEYGNF